MTLRLASLFRRGFRSLQIPSPQPVNTIYCSFSLSRIHNILFYFFLFTVCGDFWGLNFINKPLCLLLHRFCVSTLAGRYCKLRAVHIFTISSLMPHSFACVVNVCLNSFCVSPFIDKIPSYTICTIFPFFAFYPILIGKQFWKHRKSRENCRPFLPAFYRSFSLLIAAIISGKIKSPPTLAGISMFFSQL